VRRSSANLLGDDDRVEPSTRGVAENPWCGLDAIFRGHDEYSYARVSFQPKLSSLGYETNIHQHKRRVEKGATATATATATTTTRVRAIRVREETRATVPVASYCTARGADGYTPTRVP